CLRVNHGANTMADAFTIAQHRTLVARKPHQINPSRIGQKNCGCPSCYQDRTLLKCEHPGNFVETAKRLVNSTLPKWNPTTPNVDLGEELALSEEKRELNNQPIEVD
ncbi:hypothetical protein DFH08DRAFT_634603, partial [Mycena albidolilacea]